MEPLQTSRWAKPYWEPLHPEMDTDYRICQNMQTIVIPGGYDPLFTGTAASIIGSAADHIAGEHPAIEVPEANNSKSAQERSERLEKGLQGAQDKIDAAQTDNIRRTIVLNG